MVIVASPTGSSTSSVSLELVSTKAQRMIKTHYSRSNTHSQAAQFMREGLSQCETFVWKIAPQSWCDFSYIGSRRRHAQCFVRNCQKGPVFQKGVQR